MKILYDAVLLCSGGLDSTTLAFWLLKNKINFLPLFLNYGQHCAQTELNKLEELLPTDYNRNVVSINISDIYLESNSRLIKEANLWKEKVSYEDMYLPYRNLLFLSIAAAFAQCRNIKRVYAAFINSNHAKEIDCSAIFFNQLSDILHEYGSVQIEMPFKLMSKYEVVKLGLNLGVPIAKTFSCQISSKVPCGACPNCVERLNALKKLDDVSNHE